MGDIGGGDGQPLNNNEKRVLWAEVLLTGKVRSTNEWAYAHSNQVILIGTCLKKHLPSSTYLPLIHCQD